MNSERRVNGRSDLQLRSGARERRRRKMLINRAILLSPVIIILLIIILCLIPKNNDEEVLYEAGKESAGVGLIEAAVNVSENKAKYEFTRKNFTADDASLLDIRKICECSVDKEALITAPLDWDMTSEDFTVLIMHSHISESYTKSRVDSYAEIADYRTENERYNMTAVGDAVTEILKRYGINVIHDTTSYEYPDSDHAYENARVVLKEKLSEDPSIKLVIDLHRDAAETESGEQWGPTLDADGKDASLLSFVIGTSCEMDKSTDWEKNLSYTLKLEAQLEKMYPGMCRQTLVSGYEYNQDLDAVFLLAEVGLAGNTLNESKNAAVCLAKGVLELAKGAN